MALKWKGRVRETTTTTGTGALTLGGAVTSYGTFASLMSSGDTCYGTVAHRTTTEWEDCLFTMGADGTLTRTTVIDGSSGAGTPVSLSSGTKDVFLGLPPAIVETLLGASLVTLGSVAYATSERTLTAGSGISLTDAGAGSTLTVANTAQGVTDHGALTGLTDDDHTNYALLAPTTDARNVIQPTAATVKALVLKGAASQSDNLLEIQNSGGTAVGYWTPSGNIAVTVGAGGGPLFASTIISGSLVAPVAANWEVSGGDLNAKTFGGSYIAGRIYGDPTITMRTSTILGNDQPVGTTPCIVNAVSGQTAVLQKFTGYSSTTAAQDIAAIDATYSVATHASRTGRLSFSTYYLTTAQEILTLTANSAGVASSTATFACQNIVTPIRLSIGNTQSAPSSDQSYVIGYSNTCTTSAINQFVFGQGNTISGSASSQALVGTGNSITSTGEVRFVGGTGNACASGVSYFAIGGSNTISGGAVGVMGNTVTASASRSIAIGTSTSVSVAGTFGIGMADQNVTIDLQRFSSTNATRTAAKIVASLGVSTDASREGILSLYATDFNGDRLGFQVTGDGTNTEIGFYGVTPVARPSAYTQTYSTADKTHAAPTAATLSMADGAGTNDNTIGAITADASVIAAFQELVDENNKLVADLADIKQLVNSMIDDLQSLGLLQ